MHEAIARLIERPAPRGRDPQQVAISTRIRLARNILHLPFPCRMSDSQRRHLVTAIGQTCSKLLADRPHDLLSLDALCSTEAQVLVERHLVSPAMATTGQACAALIDRSERLSLMIGEEDHLRLQVLVPGCDLSTALSEAIALDQRCENELGYAYDERFGYLTACPTNTGTGLRASVMLHLPALTRSGDLRAALTGIARLHLTVRGLYGEGTDSTGDYYQISNQRTLGRSEQDVIEELDEVVRHLSEHERLAREQLRDEHQADLADLIGRARGCLAHAHVLSSDEACTLLAQLRLGIACGELPDELLETLDHIDLTTRSAHLRLSHPDCDDTDKRKRLRARLLREWMATWN